MRGRRARRGAWAFDLWAIENTLDRVFCCDLVHSGDVGSVQHTGTAARGL